MDNPQHLTKEEVDRARIAAEYELWESIFQKQHGISAKEVAETVKWYQERREWLQSLKRGGSLGIIGFAITGAAVILWEGLKIALRKGM